MANRLNAKKISSRIRRSRRSLLRQLGNNSLNFFKVENWEAQGFIDRIVRKWKQVEGKPAGQKILVRTGRLRRSGRSKVVSSTRAQAIFDAPYASYVNKDRPFVGKSETLDKQNEKLITRFVNRIFE